MLFDLMSYAGWLVAALAIGVVIGWQTYSDARGATGAIVGSSGPRLPCHRRHFSPP